MRGRGPAIDYMYELERADQIVKLEAEVTALRAELMTRPLKDEVEALRAQLAARPLLDPKITITLGLDFIDHAPDAAIAYVVRHAAGGYRGDAVLPLAATE